MLFDCFDYYRLSDFCLSQAGVDINTTECKTGTIRRG